MSDQVEQTAENPEEGAVAAADESAEAPAEAPEEASADAAAEADGQAEVVEEAPAPAEEAAPAEAAPPAPAYQIPEPKSELSRPAVIDIAAFLAPIPGDNPSGEYLRYSGVYDEINEARRADDTLAQGTWQHELKVADYREVMRIGSTALREQSKDLQIAALFVEALVREHGFEGLRDGLRLLTGLQEVFWDTLFPEIDEGDMEGRANALALMDTESAFAVQKAVITGYEGFTYFDFLDSKKYDLPDNIDSLATEEAERLRALEAEAVKENKVTADKWHAEIVQSRRAFYEELDVVLNECLEALAALNLSVESKFDIKQAPSLRNVKKALDDIKLQTDKLLEKKREEEPDEVEVEAADGEAGAGSKGGATGTSGAIQSRQEALRRLSELARYFRKTEPHSPVSYLVNRAVKWGNMPLESWLQDVIKDEAILFQLRQTLGFNTADGSDEAGTDAAAAE